MTFPLALKLLQLKLVEVVAGVKPNGPALKAEGLVAFLAVVAGQLNDLLLLAAGAVEVVVLRSAEVHQHMTLLALQQHRPLLVYRHLLAIFKAVLTEAGAAVAVIVVLAAPTPAPHAPELVLLLHKLLVADQAEGRDLVLAAAR